MSHVDQARITIHPPDPDATLGGEREWPIIHPAVVVEDGQGGRLVLEGPAGDLVDMLLAVCVELMPHDPDMAATAGPAPRSPRPLVPAQRAATAAS